MRASMAKNIISIVSNKGGVGKTSIAIAAGMLLQPKIKGADITFRAGLLTR